MKEPIVDIPSKIAVSIKDLTKKFKVEKTYIDVLTTLSFEIQKQEIISILGSSGCGKSTLLRLIAGLEVIDSGIISIFGQTPEKARTKGLVGFAFQDPSLLPWRTVIENVSLPFDINPNSKSDDLINKSLELVELDNKTDLYPKQLSGGMSERVGLARAIVSEPKLLLLDEPFRSLDEITRRNLNVKLRGILHSKDNLSTTIFVTHSIVEALYLSNRVIVLSGQPASIIKIWDIPKIILNNAEEVYNNMQLMNIREEILDAIQE